MHRADSRFAALSLSAVLALIGCGGGGSDVPELGDVSGVVTMDGEPLPEVVVTFQPQGDGGRGSIGRTDENGNYSLQFNESTSGAIVGKHKVTITTPTEAPSPTGEPEDPIPARYNSQSELVKEVKPGDNEINFELTSE